MTDPLRRIAYLDVTLFDGIATQTSVEDRRAMLGVQQTVIARDGAFSYLEIGSHLGGSIQPYLLSPACTQIYSIDPRPKSQPDDRGEGHVAHYPDNSTERMLENLRSVDAGAVDKVTCFESDARDVDPAAIEIKPTILFIDGEHTAEAVKSDFAFCRRHVVDGGVIIFHDFPIIKEAIFDIAATLRGEGILAFLIEGSVFGAFLDPALVHEDDYLAARYKQNRYYHRMLEAQLTVGRFAPEPIKHVVRRARAALFEGR